ncbi:hypothetical protein [Sphingomonas kyeonggiensis]|uniref:Uncharacterized protein n=1 Tax=Sphingomonas kyeonggiensis TaxID=1268553 RepID=A0A7W6JXN8_9SPHN|nr:hypothetical protein [Sphingomonas kyeonggiensis]MBB4101478.1 hypothetical protein [Sphingomonas kyeonggiensis]
MLRIPSAMLPVVTAETRNILAATDQALLAHCNLFAAVLEGARSSDVPLHVSQGIYARIIAHGSKLIEGREDMRQIVARMLAVKEQSDQREVALGCPAGAPSKVDGTDGIEFFTGATLSSDIQAA